MEGVVSIDGVYGFVYCGAVDLGIGAFIVENGRIRGRDYGGLSYSGTAEENADKTITIRVTYHVPAGGVLVQGVTPQDVPYDKVIEQDFPPLFGDGQPVETASPPVTAMIRRLPPPEVTKVLDTQVELMNKQAPIEINPLQKMTHVSRNGGVILYSIETAVPQDQWTQEMRDRPRRETTKVMCSDKDTRLLLDYGFQMRYLFTDASGLYVTSFNVSKDKCLAAQ